MTLQQLKYIVAVDEYRHFGKAAESFGLTQSTLSLMIKKMEEELDVLIFDRDQHPVVPTEIGRKIIEQAKIALYQVESIREMTLSEREVLSGNLNLALISTVAPVLVPGLFKYTRTTCPELKLQTREMLSDTIIDRLKKAEVDIGILAGREEIDPELMLIPVYHERFFAYVSPDDSLFAQDSVTQKELLDRPIWIMRNGMRLLDRSEIQDRSHFTYERFFEGGRVGILVQIVNENGGVTIIPETHIPFLPESKHASLKAVVPERKRTIYLALRKDYVHERMLNHLLRAIKSIIPPALLDPLVRPDHISL